MHLILRLLLNASALLFVAYLIPGFEVSGFGSAIIAAVVIGLVNAIVRPIILFFTLPITILTLGLFTFVINAVLLWGVASILEGFEIANFSAAFLGAIILWLVSILTSFILKKD